MTHSHQDPPATGLMHAIVVALQACYGDLADPSFHKVSTFLDGNPYQSLISSLKNQGISVTETTDLNDDVSVQLIAEKDDDEVAIELSGVGPFAALRHSGPNGRDEWITGADNAPTPLAALVANTVRRDGFNLLDRTMATEKIRMWRADGTEDATLYQALFTDNDVIP
jgi:hypothetical protein